MIKEHINKNAKLYVGGGMFGKTKEVKFAESIKKKNSVTRRASLATAKKTRHTFHNSNQGKHERKMLGVNTSKTGQEYITSKLDALNRNQVRKHWWRGSDTTKYTTERLEQKREKIVARALGNVSGRKGSDMFTKKYWTGEGSKMWQTSPTSGEGQKTRQEQQKTFQENLKSKTRAFLNSRALSSGTPSKELTAEESTASKTALKASFNSSIGQLLEARKTYKETKLKTIHNSTAALTKKISNSLTAKRNSITERHKLNEELKQIKLNKHYLQQTQEGKTKINNRKAEILEQIKKNKKTYETFSTKSDRNLLKQHQYTLENKTRFGFQKRNMFGIARQSNLYYRDIKNKPTIQKTLINTKKTIRATRNSLKRHNAIVSKMNSTIVKQGDKLLKEFYTTKTASDSGLDKIQEAPKYLAKFSEYREKQKQKNKSTSNIFHETLRRNTAKFMETGKAAHLKSMEALKPENILQQMKNQHNITTKAEELEKTKLETQRTEINENEQRYAEKKTILEAKNKTSIEEVSKLNRDLTDLHTNLGRPGISPDNTNAMQEAIKNTTKLIASHNVQKLLNDIEIRRLELLYIENVKEKKIVNEKYSALEVANAAKTKLREEEIQKLTVEANVEKERQARETALASNTSQAKVLSEDIQASTPQAAAQASINLSPQHIVNTELQHIINAKTIHNNNLNSEISTNYNAQLRTSELKVAPVQVGPLAAAIKPVTQNRTETHNIGSISKNTRHNTRGEYIVVNSFENIANPGKGSNTTKQNFSAYIGNRVNIAKKSQNITQKNANATTKQTLKAALLDKVKIALGKVASGASEAGQKTASGFKEVSRRVSKAALATATQTASTIRAVSRKVLDTASAIPKSKFGQAVSATASTATQAIGKAVSVAGHKTASGIKAAVKQLKTALTPQAKAKASIANATKFISTKPNVNTGTNTNVLPRTNQTRNNTHLAINSMMITTENTIPATAPALKLAQVRPATAPAQRTATAYITNATQAEADQHRFKRTLHPPAPTPAPATPTKAPAPARAPAPAPVRAPARTPAPAPTPELKLAQVQPEIATAPA